MRSVLQLYQQLEKVIVITRVSLCECSGCQTEKGSSTWETETPVRYWSNECSKVTAEFLDTFKVHFNLCDAA